ncbi:MAG: isochorismate synthase [Flavobacterium sp.]|nr:isochorismate synthase [Flavobacterium sp.]
MKLLLEKAKQQFESNLPFVLYKKPNINSVRAVFQKNDSLNLVHDFTEKGFVFASFDGNQTILIPENQSEVYEAKLLQNDSEINQEEWSILNESARTDFEKLVTNGIQAIKKDEFQKVVLSRKEVVELVDFDVVQTFEKLIQCYSNAFVYCFFHPKIGLWFGASPEQLVQSNGNNFKTISLAGTQKSNDFENLTWKDKEMKEQQFVTDYIVAKLKNVTIQLEVSEPYSFKAGMLWHLKTDISGEIQSDFGLQKIVRMLHPTPAVCGFPKENARKFIVENEQYNRSFYTGFLGELNCGAENEREKSDLFVNLRCMEIVFFQDTKELQSDHVNAILYMGCGITKDSIPEKEWQESVNKSMTMKRVLNL